MTTYFISDIHLHAGSTENSRLLLEFLEKTAVHADAVYILGDLFALWLGDDLEQPYATILITALQKLAQQNVPIYIMRGNRDFLLGTKFCQAAGCTLLADPCVIDLYGKRVLLTHGDLLCTADLGYQKFRRFVQNPFIRSMFLALPKALRIKLGLWVKNKVNRIGTNNLTIDFNIYDVTPSTVQAWISQHKVTYLIHGHTHKPEIHSENNAVRIVLGDWTEASAKVLQFNSENFSLYDLTAPQTSD